MLLFYPDGKRSSSSEAHLGGGEAAVHGAAAVGGQAALFGIPNAPAAGAGGAGGAAAALPDAGHDGHGQAQGGNQQIVAHHPQQAPVQVQLAAPRQPRRDTTNEYAALFVALIGEGPNPQGVVNTSEGKVVRAFHRFTLVDQTGQGRDLTKGRTREAGAVKISCARQDPNARNCHGYRKFVKRSILEDPARGFLLNDTIVIKYTIELVVSSGGALSRSGNVQPSKAELIKVPPSTMGKDLAELFYSGMKKLCLVWGRLHDLPANFKIPVSSVSHACTNHSTQWSL